MRVRDIYGDELRYGVDVELIHCTEDDCREVAFEVYGWRCVVCGGAAA